MGSVCPDTGNTAWLLISTLLVLSMIPGSLLTWRSCHHSAPRSPHACHRLAGLSFFEAGLLRRKSVLSILTQMFLGYAVMGVMWFVIGFSLVFGPDHGGVVGDGTHALLRGLSNNCAFDQAEGVPSLVYALFQLMFAAITPLLITGYIGGARGTATLLTFLLPTRSSAFAERMRLLGFLAFIVVWELLVYYPVAHLIWHPQGLLFRLGVQDFAGGLTIHTTAGVGALVSSHLLGRRHGFEKCHGEFPPHSVPLAAIGVAFLTTGWGGFNAGSAMGSGFVAAQALANTAVCCTVTALTWAVISAIQFRKRIKPVMILNSFVVGLAGITPGNGGWRRRLAAHTLAASGYIETWACLPLGIILGVSSYFGTMLLKKTRIE